ncbi:MAG: Ig-like domain-containing protein [Bacteroidales bacterium]|nr:Ig-like domain-containing protein [Bacteroidales bacterium]
MKSIKLLAIIFAAACLLCAGCKKDKSENISPDVLEFPDYPIKIQLGDSFQPEIIVEPANLAGKIKWKSSNKNVVTVKNGILTAEGEGLAEISATIGNSTALVDVEVVPKRYILSLMKLDNDNKGVLQEMKDGYMTTTFNVDGDYRYIVLWDNETQDYVKAEAVDNFDENFTGKFIGEGTAAGFAPLKTEWAMYGYHGILLINRKPRENAQLNIRFNISEEDWIQMTVHINTYYAQDVYFCLKDTDYPLATLQNIVSSVQIVAKKPNADKTALEQINKAGTAFYEVSANDDRIDCSVVPDPSGDYCYFNIKRKNNSENIELSDKVYVRYYPSGVGTSGYSSKVLRFTTKAVTYYDIVALRM